MWHLLDSHPAICVEPDGSFRTGAPWPLALMPGSFNPLHRGHPSTRDALREVVNRSLRTRRRAYIFVNNRLEGNAPATIEAVVVPEET